MAILYFSEKRSNIFTEKHISPFTIYPAEFETPFIASLPHSGMYIPNNLKELYTEEHLNRLRNTDWHLDQLYDFLPSIGVTILKAEFSRYVVDVNRALVANNLCGLYNKCAVYNRDTWGDPILKTADCDLKIESRVEEYYKPFHRALGQLIDEKKTRFGRACLLDLHSFTAFADEDICLGSGSKNHSNSGLMNISRNILNEQGFSIGAPHILSGGHITQYYGAMDYVDAMQIELQYQSYLPDESVNGDHIPSLDFARVAQTKPRLKTALTETVNAVIQTIPYSGIEFRRVLPL